MNTVLMLVLFSIALNFVLLVAFCGLVISAFVTQSRLEKVLKDVLSLIDTRLDAQDRRIADLTTLVARTQAREYMDFLSDPSGKVKSSNKKNLFTLIKDEQTKDDDPK